MTSGPMYFGRSREVDSDESFRVSCGDGFSGECGRVLLLILHSLIHCLRHLYADRLNPKLWRCLKCPAV
jgi:hypothetical protein